MTDSRKVEGQISLWFEKEEAVSHFPDRLLKATFEQTRELRQARSLRWRNSSMLRSFGMLAAAGAAVALIVVVGAAFLRTLPNQPGVGGPAADPRTPFLGTWISTSDADGGTQTMTVERAGNTTVDIVVTDTIASVCDRTPSTMTGDGSVEGNNLVIPTPDYRCDDGTEPRLINGDTTPLNEVLRDLAYVRDSAAETLTDNFGGLWLREGTVTPDPAPQATDPTGSSSSMWPQSTLEEVRQAQDRADAGDPGYAWQVDAELVDGADGINWRAVYDGQVEIVDRFLRDELGWDAYLQNSFADAADSSLLGQQFLRCGPGHANPLFPPQPDSGNRGESCAPTIDELTYEAINFDLVQPDRNGANGIWVVQNWSPATFEQADPAVAEEQATARLKDFLDARVAGSGAENRIDVYGEWVGGEIPLLYATTSGSPYERYEFERVDGPEWPYGGYIKFAVRLFAADGTVVEQPIESHWDGGRSVGLEGGLALYSGTTENGQAITMPFEQFDGEITYLSPSVGAWSVGQEGFLDFTDPTVYWSDCATSPAPADAAAFAEAVIADPDFETTEPAAALIGGVEGIAMDVALSAGGEVCGPFRTDVHQWINSLEPGKRMRLYLVDVPDGLSMRALAVTVMAAEERFGEVLADAEPIIDSIEFHPGL